MVMDPSESPNLVDEDNTVKEVSMRAVLQERHACAFSRFGTFCRRDEAASRFIQSPAHSIVEHQDVLISGHLFRARRRVYVAQVVHAKTSAPDLRLGNRRRANGS